MKNSNRLMMYVSIALALGLIAVGIATRPTHTPVERVSIEYRVDVPVQEQKAQVVQSAPSVADETLTTLVESYVDTYEDNAEAMIALATEDMRARENWQLVRMMVVMTVVFALLFIVFTSLPRLWTLLLARSVQPTTTGEWKVRDL